VIQRLIAPFAVLVLLLAGCAASDAEPVPSFTAADGVVFSGPWAKEFSDAYREAKSSFVKRVLKDGKVSDGEFAEMEEQFRSCLADASVGFDGFGFGGTVETKNLGGVSTEGNFAALERCSDETGEYPISPLYYQPKSNPQNLDGPTITAECFVKRKVVPPGYSAKDYERDAPGSTFPFTDEKAGAEALEICTYDPLGLLGEE